MYSNSQNEGDGGDYLKKLSDLMKPRKKKKLLDDLSWEVAPEGAPSRMGGGKRLRRGDAWDYNPRTY